MTAHGERTHKTVLLCFADSRLSMAMRRVRRQVEGLGVFDKALYYDELDLPRDFVKRNAEVFAHRTRGFGFMTWKPHLIERELLKLDNGDVLVWSDVGNHFDAANAGRLEEYVALARASPASTISTVLAARYPERAWSKREILRHLGVEENAEILDSPQRETNFIVIVNSPASRSFVREWNAAQEAGAALFDDSMWLAQDPAFRENRHDQSAFSILGKLRGAVTIPAEIDDFALRRRDRRPRRALVRYTVFLLRNGLLARRLGLAPRRPEH